MVSRAVAREMRLTIKLETLLLMAVGQCGSYHASQCMPFIEERLTLAEFNAAMAFLDWMVNKGLEFGHANIRQRFKEFQEDKR